MASDTESFGRGGRVTRRGFITTLGAGAVGAVASRGAAPATTGEEAAPGGTVELSLRINGDTHRLRVEPRATLLEVLRDRLELTGTKPGCERGECGACTVLLDGVPRYACLTLAVECVGREITTVEGLSSGEELGPTQRAFVEHDAFQCGYCTPGQVMAAEGLLRASADPTPGEIRLGMSGNLCRCGAYAHIFKAVRRAGEPPAGGGWAMRREGTGSPQAGVVPAVAPAVAPAMAPPGGPELPPWTETVVVGRPLPRIDAHERVSGSAPYTRDLSLPGMLHAAILRCPHPHARVTRVDAGAARGMAGVHAVITGDSPEARIPWRVVAGVEGAPASVLFDPVCRFAGEEVAALAADTPAHAAAAVRAIVVEYQPLPFVVDHVAAAAPGAPPVHPRGNRQGETDVYTRGDIDKGFAEADAVVERTYRTPTQLHTTMEVHGSVARWEGDRLTVWDSTQGVFGVRAELARALRLPLANVRVVSRFMGGGFGSKLELGKYTVIAALLARRTGRPVRCVLSREETFTCTGNRPANTITLKAGARRDGTLTALHGVFLGGVGAYPSGAISPYLVWDLYLCPNVKTEETEVYLNADPARPFRAPGFPPCAWALEQLLDELAARLGLDPLELRLKNIPTTSQRRQNRPFTSTGLKRCLEEGAKAFGWREARRRPRGRGHLRRGVGLAAGMWGYPGQPNATAIVKLLADGSAILSSGASDLGTGTRTVLAQVVAEELGVPLDRIQVENADTATTEYAPASGGSQTVLVNAPAVRAAAVAVKRELLGLAAEELKTSAERLALRDGAVEVSGEGARRVPFGELASLARRQALLGVGRRGPLPADKVALPFVAQLAEVEVDTRTGEIRVVRMVAAHDSGRVMNRLTYENQVFGGIAMGIGYALTEQRVIDRPTGRVVNANWHDYRIPTALDVPAELTCLPIDPGDVECNTVGAKGLGEPATIPTAAAIANAVRDAIGVAITDGPITPRRVLEALAESARKG